MDHNEALGIQASVRYVLGELPPSLREEFEEHYFDCVECSLDLEATVAFVTTCRKVFQHEAPS